MGGICLDRLIAIMLYGRYSLIVTVPRAKFFTLFCWTTFFSVNTLYILLRVCCLITPLRNNHFYTFGYGEFEDEGECGCGRLPPGQRRSAAACSAPPTCSRSPTRRWS